MIYVDAALLNLIEAACRRFQVLTGRTNVWLAFQLTNLSIVVYFVLAAVYFWSSPAVARIALVLFCGGLLYLLTQTIFKVTVELHESSAYRRVAKGFRNPRRVRDAPLRIAFLTLSVLLFFPVLLVHRFIDQSSLHISGMISAAPLLSYSLIALTTSVLYLLACDPLPPCAGRITEWIRALIAVRRRTSESGAATDSSPAVRTAGAAVLECDAPGGGVPEGRTGEAGSLWRVPPRLPGEIRQRKVARNPLIPKTRRTG